MRFLLSELLTDVAQLTARGPAAETAIVESSGLTVLDWVVAGGVLLVGYVLSVVMRRVVVSVLRRGTTSETIAERIVGRVVQAAVVLIALAYALGVVGVKIAPLLGALGIGGIAVALALQPTLQNLFSGIVLHAQRPIRLGEEVVTGDTQGQVVDITSRAVVILANSGETVVIPNSVVLDREIVNLVRHGRRRTTVVVGVAYGTDVARARAVIRTATEGVEGVLADPPPRVLAHEFADSSVTFDVDFWHRPEEPHRRMTRDGVVEAVHAALFEAGITIPFPQRTLWSGADAETPRAIDGS